VNGAIDEHRDRVREWVAASEDIRDRFGLEKALGYVVGEKLYNTIVYGDQIAEEIGQAEFENLLSEFAELVNLSFTRDEIESYFKKTPRFGALGHVATEAEHRLFVEKGVVEHSIITEATDAQKADQMLRLLREGQGI